VLGRPGRGVIAMLQVVLYCVHAKTREEPDGPASIGRNFLYCGEYYQNSVETGRELLPTSCAPVRTKRRPHGRRRVTRRVHCRERSGARRRPCGGPPFFCFLPSLSRCPLRFWAAKAQQPAAPARRPSKHPLRQSRAPRQPGETPVPPSRRPPEAAPPRLRPST
jgi:hypothetical protein